LLAFLLAVFMLYIHYSPTLMLLKKLVSIVNKGKVSFTRLKGLRVQYKAADYLRDIRVYFYKEVYKNVIGVLGFGYFSIISVAYLGTR